MLMLDRLYKTLKMGDTVWKVYCYKPPIIQTWDQHVIGASRAMDAFILGQLLPI